MFNSRWINKRKEILTELGWDQLLDVRVSLYWKKLLILLLISKYSYECLSEILGLSISTIKKDIKKLNVENYIKNDKDPFYRKVCNSCKRSFSTTDSNSEYCSTLCKKKDE